MSSPEENINKPLNIIRTFVKEGNLYRQAELISSKYERARLLSRNSYIYSSYNSKFVDNIE